MATSTKHPESLSKAVEKYHRLGAKADELSQLHAQNGDMESAKMCAAQKIICDMVVEDLIHLNFGRRIKVEL